MSEEQVGSLRAENAELHRLLEKHHWGGLTPIKSMGACPECAGSRPPEGRGHRPGCAIAAALAAAGGELRGCGLAAMRWFAARSCGARSDHPYDQGVWAWPRGNPMLGVPRAPAC
jgi:hypothetical protein